MLLSQASVRYLDGVKWGECSNGNLFLIDLTCALDNGLILVFSDLILRLIDTSNLI